MSVVRHKVTNNLRCELDYNRKAEYLQRSIILLFYLKKQRVYLNLQLYSVMIFMTEYSCKRVTSTANELQVLLYCCTCYIDLQPLLVQYSTER